MEKRLLFLLLCLLSLDCFAQRTSVLPEVSVVLGDSLYAIEPTTTQSEYRPGWKIVDIQTKGKSSRYLWGKSSRQMTDDRLPEFVFNIGNYKINDFVLIKLKVKKDYRKFASHNFLECDFRPVDLDLASIKVLDNDKYLVKFHNALEPGEYVFANLKQPSLSEYGDIKVYAFTIPQD